MQQLSVRLKKGLTLTSKVSIMRSMGLPWWQPKYNKVYEKGKKGKNANTRIHDDDKGHKITTP